MLLNCSAVSSLDKRFIIELLQNSLVWISAYVIEIDGSTSGFMILKTFFVDVFHFANSLYLKKDTAIFLGKKNKLYVIF